MILCQGENLHVSGQAENGRCGIETLPGADMPVVQPRPAASRLRSTREGMTLMPAPGGAHGGAVPARRGRSRSGERRQIPSAMIAPDLSRQDLQFFTALAALGAYVLGVFSGQLFIGQGAAWAGVGGALVGGLISFTATELHDRRRRVRELAALKASIYAEIADRAARCVNDYLNPWSDLRIERFDTLSAERVRMFRPTDPVVLPGISGKIGILDARVLLAVTQFYFRLDALSQAIESVGAICERRENDKYGESQMEMMQDDRGAKLIATRLRSCFEPALRVIERLDVPEAKAFDQEAARVYPHLRDSGLSLRDALRKYTSEIGSKKAEERKNDKL
jgi:hypothetical protein